MSSDVVIIGAGPGGLAAAMLLSRAGARVKVLERQNQVGGRTATIGENGYRFDLGPTFFLYPDILREIFVACGLRLEDEVDMIKLDPHYQLHFENSDTLLATPDQDQMEREVTRLSPQDAGGFGRFMQDNRKKFAAFKPVLQKPFSSLLDIINFKMAAVLPYFRPGRSVERDLRSFFRDERLRLACAFQSKYLGMSPFTCPSIFTILSFLEYEYGVFHPVGGCASVSRAMARAAEKLGAEIHLSEAVTRLEFEGNRVRRAVTEDGEYPCDALVINADFAHAMQELVPDTLRKRWSNEALQKKKYSCSTFMMYLGVKRTIPQLQHHNIFLSSVYQENLTDIERDHRLSDNPSFYVCHPTTTDASMAPAGTSALYILVPVTHLHDNVDWETQTRRYRDLILKQLNKIGITDLEPDIEYERIITPAAWESEFAVHRGAVFNLAHSLDQMLFLRPQNRFKELGGVYLVGGGTHPGSGLPVIYESARISSRLVAKDLGL